MAELIGETLASRYRIDSALAHGGMASVYLATDTVLERRVAVKVIHPHLAKDRSFADKFRREAKVAAKLSHPNLVNVFDQGNHDGTAFLVMEYVAGITLRDVIRDFGALPAGRVIEIAVGICDGLAAVHRAGIVHRDLKPENVFLGDDGGIKLGDFGLARAVTDFTQTGSVVGTVGYLSPELVNRGQADTRSDIYSFGVMLFELLCGRQPFSGDQPVQIAYQHANAFVPAPSSINPEVSELLDELVLWTTAKQPIHRPYSAIELLPIIQKTQREILGGSKHSLAKLAETIRLENTEVLASEQTLILSQAPNSLLITKPSRKLIRGQKLSDLLLVTASLAAIFGSAIAGWWLASQPLFP